VIGSPQLEAEIAATPVDCRSMPRFTPADQRHVLRAFALITGDSIHLGALMTETPGLEPIAGRRMRRFG
jgi:hypothetical protein